MPFFSSTYIFYYYTDRKIPVKGKDVLTDWLHNAIIFIKDIGKRRIYAV